MSRSCFPAGLVWGMNPYVKPLVILYLTSGSVHIEVELALRSGSAMNCHATTRGLIPGGNGVFTELHVLRKRQ